MRDAPSAQTRNIEVADRTEGLTVCLDGFNLGLTLGTGIATYARNLNASIMQLGYGSNILYGPSHTFGNDDLANEVALVDAHRPGPRTSWIRQVLRDAARLRPDHVRVATPIIPTGEVLFREMAHRFPPCDRRWVSEEIFDLANRMYTGLRKFTRLRFGEGKTPGVMHWTCPLPIRATDMPNLYTVHDLVPLRLPFASADNKRRFMALCKEICASSDRIVTVSEQSKRDIIRILGAQEDKIFLSYQSVHLPEALKNRPDADVAQELEGAFGLDWRGYFIFYGAIEPKKNLARVIEAYLASGVSAPLVIIGGKGWLHEDATRLIYDDLVEASVLRDGLIRRRDRIRVYDYMPFPLLVSLIRGARATLLPSLYEGFGLPVLESMLLRTPVLTSTEGSLGEIAGDAAQLVDPYDTQAIRRAIVALDRDGDLRTELIARGEAQAAKFSVEAYNSRLADLYRPFS
jgi:glycosyltransferase involved in cell wall biosynthesis